MFQTNVVEKIKTHILCSIFFLLKKIGRGGGRDVMLFMR